MRGVYDESEYVFCDLQSAVRYLRRYSRETGEAFLDAAYDTFEFIADNPGIGRPRPEFGYVGLRSWRIRRFPKYLIFYREMPEKVQIWRVLHGSQDLDRILGESNL